MKSLIQNNKRKIMTSCLLLVCRYSYAEEEGKLNGPLLMDQDMTGNLMQTTLGLLVILAIIFAVAWAVKRFGNYQSGVHGHMKIIGGVSLGARERAVLIQVGDEQLVLGVAPGHIQTLHILSTPLPVSDKEENKSSRFSDKLHAVIKNSNYLNSDNGKKK